MAEQIDKYGDKLFADPIEVDTHNESIVIYPQRTNNIMEQFFRDQRHAYRRKTGNDCMCRALQAMPADAPLLKRMYRTFRLPMDHRPIHVGFFRDFAPS